LRIAGRYQTPLSERLQEIAEELEGRADELDEGNPPTDLIVTKNSIHKTINSFLTSFVTSGTQEAEMYGDPVTWSRRTDRALPRAG
jgi:hypothetical protein